MKLNKLQRYTVYSILLCELETTKSCKEGLCSMIDDIFGFYPSMSYPIIYDYSESFSETLPELFNKRPNHYRPYWWPTYDIKSRINAIKKCIEETHPDLLK